MKVSIAIPCYEMYGRGAECLDYSLAILERQTYKNIEIVVSDHSLDESIKNTCKKWDGLLDIKYIKNTEKRGASSANHNNCIKHCEGDIIKFLCQDDYLYSVDSLQKIINHFSTDTKWLVSRYIHTRDRTCYFNEQIPWLNGEIHVKNTIGTHSCLAIRNDNPPLFDEDLIWFMDCEYYRQLYNHFGLPYVLQEITMVQFLWEGQVTNTSAASNNLRMRELKHIQKKYPQVITDLPLVKKSNWLKETVKKIINRGIFESLTDKFIV